METTHHTSSETKFPIATTPKRGRSPNQDKENINGNDQSITKIKTLPLYSIMAKVARPEPPLSNSSRPETSCSPLSKDSEAEESLLSKILRSEVPYSLTPSSSETSNSPSNKNFQPQVSYALMSKATRPTVVTTNSRPATYSPLNKSPRNEIAYSASSKDSQSPASPVIKNQLSKPLYKPILSKVSQPESSYLNKNHQSETPHTSSESSLSPNKHLKQPLTDIYLEESQKVENKHKRNFITDPLVNEVERNTPGQSMVLKTKKTKGYSFFVSTNFKKVQKDSATHTMDILNGWWNQMKPEHRDVLEKLADQLNSERNQGEENLETICISDEEGQKTSRNQFEPNKQAPVANLDSQIIADNSNLKTFTASPHSDFRTVASVPSSEPSKVSLTPNVKPGKQPHARNLNLGTRGLAPNFDSRTQVAASNLEMRHAPPVPNLDSRKVCPVPTVEPGIIPSAYSMEPRNQAYLSNLDSRAIPSVHRWAPPSNIASPPIIPSYVAPPPTFQRQQSVIRHASGGNVEVVEHPLNLYHNHLIQLEYERWMQYYQQLSFYSNAGAQFHPHFYQNFIDNPFYPYFNVQQPHPMQYDYFMNNPSNPTTRKTNKNNPKQNPRNQ